MANWQRTNLLSISLFSDHCRRIHAWQVHEGIPHNDGHTHAGNASHPKTGSIYLHCDPNASHYLKLMMDSVFGQQNFRNEIVWYYKGNSIAKRMFPAKHDTILFYAARDYVFNPILVPYADSTIRRYNHVDKVYMKEGKPADSVWDIPVVRKKKERVGYPTQKPIALLERIIKASSNSGDIVLDPFCGCATTCVAAERLQRQWIGIDLSPRAVELVKMRLERDEGLTEHGNLFA